MTHHVNANPTKKVAKRQSRFRLALSSMYKKYIDSATNFYLDRGVDPITIAGIFGNISKESGWNPLANALDNGLGDYYGLAQMSKDMRKEVKRVYGKVDADTTHQFIYDSMRGSKKISPAWRSYMKDNGGYWNNLYDTPEAAAMAFGRVFERPNEKYADWGERQLSAKDAYDYIMLVLNMRNNNIGNPIKTTITGDGRKVMTVNPNFYVESGILDSALKPQVELPVQQAAPILPRQAQPKDIAPAPWDLNQLILNRGIEVSPRKSPFSLSLSLPKLGDLLALNTPLRLMQEYFADALGVSDIMPEMPSLFPRFADGRSPIHIKEKNRGKFTALKKRTGHSASWFKAHGTPALKKMATFALNARKWRH